MSMISSLIERLRETANDIFMNIDADFPVCKADGELMSEAADTLELLSEKARQNRTTDCMTTVEEYRAKLIDTFHKTNHDELIALVTLPTEKDFDHLEWLLKNHYGNKARQRWIPVSEKLPSDLGHDWVLAQIQEDNGYLWIPQVMEYRKKLDDWFSEVNNLGWLKDHNGAFEVVAWMPLPEPYNAESEDNT